MQLEKKLARILAKEIAYRSYRRYGTQGLPLGRMSQAGRREPSILWSNGLMAIIMSFSSIFMGALPLLRAGDLDSNLMFVISSSVMLFFEAIMTITIVTSFTSVFMSEQVMDLLSILPLTERVIFRTYFRTLLLYWGGLAPVFAFIPGAILGFVAASRGLVMLSLPILLIVVGLLILIFSYSLGIALGSYARKVKRKTFLRALSTIGWLATFAFFYSWNYIIGYIARSINTEVVLWASLIPFIGMLFSFKSNIALLISTIETVIILVIALRWASLRLKIVMGLIELAPIASVRVSAREEVEVKTLKFKVKPVPLQLIIKDLMLLGREPRRLANILYFIIIPFFMLLPSLIMKSGPDSDFFAGGVITILSILMLSTLPGAAVDILYYVEGKAAEALYYMPISRRNLALYKAIAVVPFSTLSSLTLGIMLAYIYRSALLGILIFLMTLISSPLMALFFSSITVRMLPESPSAWSEASISRGALAIIKIIVTIGIFSSAIIASIILIPLLGELALLVILLTYLVVTSVLGLLVYFNIPKNKPV